MHILIIPSWYPEHDGDLNGSFFPEQVRTLRDAGHTVGVLALKPFAVYQARQLAGRPRGLQRSLEDGIPVFRRDCLLPVPKFHRLNQAVMDRVLYSMYQAYVAEHGTPDVLHAHAMFPGGIATAHVSRRSGVPFVVTEHRPSSMQRLKEPGNTGPGLRALRDASAVVAVTQTFATELNAAYGTDRWIAIPGLLSPQFQHLDVRVPGDGPFIFGHVSHLDPGKRVDLMIEAFADAFAGNNDVRLRIAGDSPARAALEELAATRGVAEQVDFVGRVARKDIAEEFSHYHSFVLVSEAEAFGTVLWEAMACGIPVVATKTWAGQTATTPDTGLLVDIDDRAALAAALTAMHDGFSRFSSDAIRQYCLDFCGAETFVHQYVTTYQEATAR